MVAVAFGAVMHQPWRIKKYRFLDIGSHKEYFDIALNRRIFERVARKSYIPTLKILKDLAEDYKDFKFNLSFTGTWFEQALEFEPYVINLLKELVATGKVELIAETFYHSLAFLISREEFDFEVNLHKEVCKKFFNYEPKIFRNTEAMYNNDVGRAVEALGLKGVITEGAEKVLGWRSPGYPYKAKGADVMLFFRNYRLSDDIAFRFSARDWDQWPLTADKYAFWLSLSPEPLILIYIDFETFGEHQWEETGIFEFLKYLPKAVSKYSHVKWANVSDFLSYKPVDEIDVPFFISWADQDRDLSAWLGNKMQRAAFNAAKALENDVKATRDPEILETWRRLITSDHFYYMSTKFAGDEEVHSYFRAEAYANAYEAFTNYMNILQDFRMLIYEKLSRE